MEASIDICGKYKGALIGHVVGQISVLSKRVKDQIPATNHLVTDQIWIKGRCKRELLEQCDRAALAASTGQLHQAIVAASASYTEFFPAGDVFEEAFESVQLASGIFKSARSTIVLIAYLHVCQELKGEIQLKEAAVLAAKNADVPKPVRDCVLALSVKAKAAEAAPPPPEAKRRRLGTNMTHA